MALQCVTPKEVGITPDTLSMKIPVHSNHGGGCGESLNLSLSSTVPVFLLNSETACKEWRLFSVREVLPDALSLFSALSLTFFLSFFLGDLLHLSSDDIRGLGFEPCPAARLICLIEKQKAENPPLLETTHEPSSYIHIVCRDNTKGKCSRTSYE
eukprot:g3077.t1